MSLRDKFKKFLPTTDKTDEPRGVLSDHEVSRLAGLCEGILIDDVVSRQEADYLLAWLKRDQRYKEDYRTAPVVKIVTSALWDDKLSKHEAADLRSALSDFCDKVLDDFEPLKPIKKEPPRQRPPRKKKQAKESSYFLPPNPGDTFDICYMKANGDVSDRRINFRSCDRKGIFIYVNAFCLNRHAFRTFRADRIMEATHLDTGECIDDPESYFAAL